MRQKIFYPYVTDFISQKTEFNIYLTIINIINIGITDVVDYFI